MWARPYFTPGEWAVYTSLWSYPNDSVFPTHQDLADRAWVERGTASDAVAKMDKLGLLERQECWRDDESQSSNTYYLIEVPTAAHLQQLEQLKVERAAVQETKRRKRKAANRKYEKPRTQGADQGAEGGYGQESTPVQTTRGGYGQDRTPGVRSGEYPRGYGTDRTLGYGTDRTHESLGVKEVLGVALTASPSSTSKNGHTFEEQEQSKIPLGDENQEEETAEFVKSAAHWPTLTEDENALAAEVAAVAPLWMARTVRKVIGSRTIREISGRDPELVRRAFLIGARDPETVPMRMWHVDGCGHWAAAAAQLAAERAAPAAQPGGEAPAVAAHRENRARVNAQVAELESADGAAESAKPPGGSAAARAQLAQTLAGKGYVPLTAATREIARQRVGPGSTAGPDAAGTLTDAGSAQR